MTTKIIDQVGDIARRMKEIALEKEIAQGKIHLIEPNLPPLCEQVPYDPMPPFTPSPQARGVGLGASPASIDRFRGGDTCPVCRKGTFYASSYHGAIKLECNLCRWTTVQ